MLSNGAPATNVCLEPSVMRAFHRLAVFAAFAFFLSAQAFAEQVTVSFIQTNDIDKFEGSGERGGFARLNAVVKAERAKGGHGCRRPNVNLRPVSSLYRIAVRKETASQLF